MIRGKMSPTKFDFKKSRRLLSFTIVMAALLVGALMSGFPFAEPDSVTHAFLPAQTEPDIFFPDGTVINVKTDYGAKGDGVTDDTQAILSAIHENLGKDPSEGAFIYFPAGTYLVSDRLTAKNPDDIWEPNLTLQGQNRSNTFIKLKDNASGYGDASNPKAVIVTANNKGTESGGGKDFEGLGEGNTAFRNYILDLTVDIGTGNPGAIGIDYLVSNIGGIRNVTIRSGDGQGHTGLAMTRKWPGPGLIKNVRVEGFDTGIALAYILYSMTMEHITLENQNVVGIFNSKNVLSIRGLESTNSVPVIRNLSNVGLVVLLDGDLKGGSPSVSAIENSGQMYLRNVTTSGYASVIESEGNRNPLKSVGEFVTAETPLLFPVPRASLNLPIEETPEVPQDPVSEWAVVTDFGARGNDKNFDNTPAFQAAIDSGATTVYVPKDRYAFKGTIFIRNNVRRLDFGLSQFGAMENNTFSAANPLFKFEDGTHSTVLLERRGRGWPLALPPKGFVAFEHASSRTLVLRNMGASYRNVPGSGPLFMEDVGLGGSTTFDTQEVWARQLNPEGAEEIKIVNKGSAMWILGMKTEKPGTIIKTIDGGQTELLGGFIFPVDVVENNAPAFINEESSQSLVYVQHAEKPEKNHEVQVRATIDGDTEDLTLEQTIKRGNGAFVMLYVGHPENVIPIPRPTPRPTVIPTVGPNPTSVPIGTPVPPTPPGESLRRLLEILEKINSASGSDKQRAALELLDLVQKDTGVDREFRNFRDTLPKEVEKGTLSKEKAEQFLAIVAAVEERLGARPTLPPPTQPPTAVPTIAANTPVAPTSTPRPPSEVPSTPTDGGGGCNAPAQGVKVVEVSWLLLGLTLPGLALARRRSWLAWLAPRLRRR